MAQSLLSESRPAARQRLASRLTELATVVLALTPFGSAAFGQMTQLAYRSNQPPGSIGAMQVARGVAPPGYVQPVRVQVPKQDTVSIAGEGEVASELHAGLLVGQPYRLKVIHTARGRVMTLYPSVEIIGRLHPPEGEKNRFPIPIDITAEDLELAESGSMVVRVIYLENPQTAFPESQQRAQRYLNVLPSEDPLQVADEMGRPMAILRLGSRKPLNGDGDAAFQFGAPPVERFVPSSDSFEPNATVVPQPSVPSEPVPNDPFQDDMP